nr:protein kinase [Angustibacter aerolatus]
MLAALAYSHRAGIVHRDIKPANVMVNEAGDVKVMDFGIARAVADTSATMTQTQAVIGTAQYLSPEQAKGETVDARSDVYSAGCLLFEPAHRTAAVRRRLAGRGGVPARRRGAAAPEHLRPRRAAHRRRHRAARAGQDPRGPLPDGRRLPRRRRGGAGRSPDQARRRSAAHPPGVGRRRAHGGARGGSRAGAGHHPAAGHRPRRRAGAAVVRAGATAAHRAVGAARADRRRPRRGRRARAARPARGHAGGAAGRRPRRRRARPGRRRGRACARTAS